MWIILCGLSVTKVIEDITNCFFFDYRNVIPVTLNMGFQMPAWFDLYSLNANGPEDETGIEKAKKYIHGLIEDEEKNGIPSNKVFLGGFSQGGALALYSGLTYTKPLAGILAMSCWIPLRTKLSFANLANANTPTFQLHGEADDVVPYSFGTQTSELLNKHLANYKFKGYRNLRHTNIASMEVSDDRFSHNKLYLYFHR